MVLVRSNPGVDLDSIEPTSMLTGFLCPLYLLTHDMPQPVIFHSYLVVYARCDPRLNRELGGYLRQCGAGPVLCIPAATTVHCDYVM